MKFTKLGYLFGVALAGVYDDGGRLGLDAKKCQNSTLIADAMVRKMPRLEKRVCERSCLGLVVNACKRVVDECPPLATKNTTDAFRPVMAYHLWADKRSVEVMCKSLNGRDTTCLEDLFKAAADVQKARTKALENNSTNYGNQDLTEEERERVCSPCTKEIYDAFQGKEDKAPGLYLLDLVDPKEDIEKIGELCGYDLAPRKPLYPTRNNPSQQGTQPPRYEPKVQGPGAPSSKGQPPPDANNFEDSTTETITKEPVEKDREGNDQTTDSNEVSQNAQGDGSDSNEKSQNTQGDGSSNYPTDDSPTRQPSYPATPPTYPKVQPIPPYQTSEYPQFKLIYTPIYDIGYPPPYGYENPSTHNPRYPTVNRYDPSAYTTYYV
ncbi:hypothetical protein L0F63_002468 [Massospora cicadina]|nr:hypothetical protein L0F63_002468 [Massospora cicadina]